MFEFGFNICEIYGLQTMYVYIHAWSIHILGKIIINIKKKHTMKLVKRMYFLFRLVYQIRYFSCTNKILLQIEAFEVLTDMLQK